MDVGILKISSLKLLDKYFREVSCKRQVGALLLRSKRAMKISVMSELLLRVMLKKIGNSNWRTETILQHKTGKPYLKSGINFNLSHSQNIILCALDRRSTLGVDVEWMSPHAPKKISDMVLHEEEKKFYNHLNKEQFFRIWVIKEAYSKYTGKGLAENFAEINTIDERFLKNVIHWFSDDYSYAIYSNNLRELRITKYREEEVLEHYD